MAPHPFRFKIGFVGAGNMAEAICRSLISAVFYKPAQLAAADPAESRTRFFRDEFGVFICPTNAAVADQSENILLAVKPQQVPAVLAEIGPSLGQDQLIISIAAGISTGFIESATGKSIPVVRVMPNTPLMIGAGATVLCRGKFATEAHLNFAKSLFASAGITLTLEENLLDAVTAVSGSGPAYFFYLIEAMVQAAVELGITRADALALAAQTALGAARMVLETGAEPEELRRRVTSPGGTTQAAVQVLDEAAVKDAVVQAIAAAARRSKELGK